MIRMLFATFVTLAGFAAIALWQTRSDDVRAVAAEIVPDEVREAVQSAVERLDIEDVAALLPARSATDAGASDAAAASQPEAAAPHAEEVVEVRDVAVRSEFARDLGEEAESGSGAGGALPPLAASDDPPWPDADGEATRVVDQDQWASLIRRMLAVYRRSGGVE